MKEEPNELDPRLMGLMGVNFLPGTITSARQQMAGSQFSQIIEHNGVNRKQIFTGIEFELGKTTFSIKAPCQMEVIKTFDLYKRSMGADTFQINPLKVVLYRNQETGYYDILEMYEYASYHQMFGYKYKYTKHAERLAPGMVFDKDTVFADTPSVTDDGFFQYSRDIETVYLTTHSSGEDGMTFARSELDAMSYRTIIKKNVQWGRTQYPVNLYGTDEQMKAFPDIGEYVHPSGILMALRDHSPELDLVGMNIHDLRNVDYFYDDLIYASSGPGGRIIDIRVWYDDRASYNATPQGMEVQPMRYLVAKKMFYSDILAKVREIEKKSNTTKLKFGPRLHQVLVDAYREVEPGPNAIENTDGTERVDIWRVEFTIEYTHIPDIRSKFTNTAGGKGVVVKVMEDEDMPVDDFGNRAKVIISTESPINRNNSQQWYEQLINAYSRDLLHHMRRLLGQPPHDPISGASILLDRQTKELQDQLIQLLGNHYRVISGHMSNQFDNMSRDKQLKRLATVLADKIYIFKPPNDPEEIIEVAKTLRDMYKGTIEQYSPVTYRGYSGQLERTILPARIGAISYMQLEKTGDSWAAVASGDLQHHGVLATISKLNRHSHPHRNQPTRAYGEAEINLVMALASPEAAAEVMDRNNSSVSHRHIVNSIYQSKDPTNIASAIDRRKVKLGNHKPLQLVKHLMRCAGFEFKYAVSSRQKQYMALKKAMKNNEGK